MRSKSPELMNRINDYVDQYYCRRASFPSMAEIGEGLGISRTTAYRYLVAMDERGMLDYDGASRTIITKKIRKFPEQMVAAPIVGAIPCGTPEEEEENVEGYIRLPVSLFGKGEFYILKASGDSMADAQIDDEDLVVIRKQDRADVGDIVANSTLKRYGGIDQDSHSAILLYQNEARYPGKRILVKELRVQGVAKQVLKSL